MAQAAVTLQGFANCAAAPHFPSSFVKQRLPDRVEQLLERAEFRRADTAEEKDAILRLRYDAYFREGGVAPNVDRRLFDRFEEMENTWSFGVFIDNRLASALRINLLSAQHPISPALDAFPDMLTGEVEAGKTIIDPNRFVADYATARRYPELPYLTLRLFYMAATFFDADLVTATVRAEHQAFYARTLGLVTVCPPRLYPTVVRPVGLMLLDFPRLREPIARRHPYFRSRPAERSALFERYDLPVGRRARLQPVLASASLGHAA